MATWGFDKGDGLSMHRRCPQLKESWIPTEFRAPSAREDNPFRCAARGDGADRVAGLPETGHREHFVRYLDEEVADRIALLDARVAVAEFLPENTDVRIPV